jgi:hypothetical protein
MGIDRPSGQLITRTAGYLRRLCITEALLPMPNIQEIETFTAVRHRQKRARRMDRLRSLAWLGLTAQTSPTRGPLRDKCWMHETPRPLERGIRRKIRRLGFRHPLLH